MKTCPDYDIIEKMVEVIGAPTLDDALAVLAKRAAENEARGEKNFIFCEDRLTLLAERAVLSRTGGTFSTEISTFSRFLSGEQRMLSKQGSVMALSAILASCGDLKCFRKGSAQAVYETIAQLSASRVNAEMLRQSAAEAEGLLALKLSDLAVLLEKYNDFLTERGLLDENGYLALLPEKISSGALKDKNVFFFAFPSFTAQAREGVRAAIENAASVTGVFIAGREEFYTNEGARAFKKIAEEYGEVKSSMVKCSLRGDALALHGGLFSPERFSLGKTKSENIRFFRAEDEAEEYGAVCALIKKYIAEGLRYRDIAVLTDGSGSFAIEKAFSAYRIPYFSDRKRAFSLHPFCAFALAALEGAAGGGLPDAVDEIASSVYFGGGDNYRNYLLKYGGYRGAYKREIKEGEAVKEYDRAELCEYRERMIKILSLFPAKGKGALYAGAVRALWELVRGEQITEELKTRFSGAEREFLDASPLEGVLAEVEEVAGAQTFTAREMKTLLENGLAALEISMIPQYSDAVFVGDITDSKFTRAEVLFCTGLTNALPRAQADTAVITDGDLKKLSELSLEIEPAIAVVNARARESFALNLCAFERALYLSLPLRKDDAETAESEVLHYVQNLFELPPMPELFPYNCSEREPASLQLLALKEDFEAGRENDGRKFSALRAVLENAGEDTERLLSGGEKQTVSGAKELYFAREISPTLLESYFACPYAGFMMRGLRLREREERTVLDTDAGTFVHAVLENVAKEFNTLATEEACRARAEAVSDELLKGARFQSLFDTKAGAYTGERLKAESAAVCVAAYRQLTGSGFHVSQTEESVAIPELGIKGTADRVDRADGYVRVIDYKTGEIDDKAVSYYTGKKLQLQLYLLAASREGKAAGAFYFPARDEFAKADEEKFRMKGFFSKEDEVLALMDKTLAEGEKSAFYEGGGRTEKGMAQEDFERFLSYASLVSARAEEEMRAGNITPSPYEGACSYCKCKGMCAFTGTPRKEEKVSCGEIVKIVRRERGEE